MMYNNKFVACIKSYGKILREQGDTVFMPFGTEYGILLKNLESRKALVESVVIDGDNVLGGSCLIIYPNNEWFLEGFLCGNTITNRFKFVEKTAQISEYRGDRCDDGLIRIEFRYEKHFHYIPRPVFNPTYRCPRCNHITCVCGDYIYSSNDCNSGLKSMKIGGGLKSTHQVNFVSYSADINHSDRSHLEISSHTAPVTDDGITVKGSNVNESLNYGSIGILESQSHVIVLKLKGDNHTGCPIKEPLFVQSRNKCEYCGTTNPSSHRCCSDCGNQLI